MTRTLALKVGVASYYGHDDSVAIFEDGELLFACESERISREKHGANEFPKRTIQIALSSCGLELSDVDTIVGSYDPSLETDRLVAKLGQFTNEIEPISHKIAEARRSSQHFWRFLHGVKSRIRTDFRRLGDSVPDVELEPHHRCHAASAYYPSPFDEALVVSIDSIGEYESTTLWIGRDGELEKLTSFEWPNSLGLLYSQVTDYLGFRPNNGEGKVMGLAPYGTENPEVSEPLRSRLTIGPEYDVTGITAGMSPKAGVNRLKQIYDREPNDSTARFGQFEKDLAYAVQRTLEDIVTSLVEHYCRTTGIETVCLAGGVALNCKMNREVAESSAVEELFVQPVANDAGVALGAGMLNYDHSDVERFEHLYFGPSFATDGIKRQLSKYKIPYTEPENLERHVAKRLANGELIGWFQGRMELGPRALGNRSILADPRDSASRDRVNRFVKDREEWRPFAPSIVEERADEYLRSYRRSPFMIDTFEAVEEKADEIEAVLHPADATTRPQTVRRDQNERYYELLSAFEDLTGVPVLLNTSFNSSGEPIVCTPKEALQDFYQMGLDTLVLNEIVISKTA